MHSVKEWECITLFPCQNVNQSIKLCWTKALKVRWRKQMDTNTKFDQDMKT